MSEEKTKIKMKLLSVDEVRFMMSSDMIDENTNSESIQIGFSNSVEPDVENETFSMVFGVRYVVKENVCLESVYRFTFSVVNLAQYISFNKDKSITIKDLMPHFLSVAVGTMRGILVVKTAGTSLARFPLPIININLLKDNLSKVSK